MPHPNVLVVVVDGLRASALGAYGNTTFPTPALDAFAAESLLLDWCYAPSADLDGIYRAMWQSLHPARKSAVGTTTAESAGTRPLLPNLLADAGYQTTIVTDEPQIASLDGASAFQQIVQVGHTVTDNGPRRRAEDEFETELARVFAAASEAILDQTTEWRAPRPRQPKLVWLHARGMYGSWDAPLDFQASLRDESDPPPVECVEPPDFVASAGGDPDVLFRYATAYAAQIITLDACWQRLIEAIGSSKDHSRWLIMLIGAREVPLGEHSRFGGVDPRLYAEQLHVPWLIRSPDDRGRLARDGRLVSHLDLLPTLIDGTTSAAESECRNLDGISLSPLPMNSTLQSRESLLSATGDGGYAIRSPAWCLREPATSDAEPLPDAATECSELYVRPDDRWEANDVSKLCPDIVEALRAAAGEMLQRYTASENAASSNNP